MLKHLGAAAALLLALQTGGVAQTMRFTTNVGSFDMVLNPTNDPNLQPLVDNIVAYIGLGRYHFSAVNRAVESGPGTADDFVLQMGGFMAFPPVPELWAGLHTPIEKLAPVTVDSNDDLQVDFNTLSNTRGAVSLALGTIDHDGDPATPRVTDPNSGTSSFFINLRDNSQGDNSLDAQGFVPFARIENMATVDEIMQLMQTDLTQEAGSNPTDATYTDVPLTDDGRIVVLKSVTVTQAPTDFSFVGPILNALRTINFETPASPALLSSLTSSTSQSSAALMAAESPPPAEAASISAMAVPEPATAALGLLGIFATFLAGRRGAKRR